MKKVSYRVEAGGLIVDVTDWDPPGFFNLEAEVVMPVNVNCYVDRRGQGRYSFVIRRDKPRGEAF